MKKILYLFCALLSVTFYACSDKNEENVYQTTKLTVELVYPEGVIPTEGVIVKVRNTVNNTSFDALTNGEGKASFVVPSGVYEASATDSKWDAGNLIVYNGLNSQVVVSGQAAQVQLQLTGSRTGSVVIKEIYAGGCPKDDGSGAFINDQSLVLYNNSSVNVDLNDFALGIVSPYNSQASNTYYTPDGKLSYASEGWIPAVSGVWYFNTPVTLEPGKQIVIAITGAIDNTQTYSQSVNYANADYYCCYDIEDYNNERYYPTPAEVIPTSHYLSAYKFGQGNAWIFSTTSPAVFIFRPEGQKLEDFINNAETTDSKSNKKIPVEWIVDGVEVFAKGNSSNKKRITEDIDAGYVEMTPKMGYTLYRNVDKEASESLEENKGKLVYNYAGGADSTTDPSGIDAEASLKNGVRIIYKDTNNSSNDFHQRAKSSLRN